jgi:hypothetical protein
MKPAEFDKLARGLFGSVLSPLGFSCELSKMSVFYREVRSGFYHVVMPDLGSRGVWYDVKVFAFASVFEPLFDQRFPDSIGIPTDWFCYLSERGVGPDQTQFNCKSEDNFRRRFETTVGPLLKSVAVPYLSQFSSMKDLLPHIRNPLDRAIAVHFVEGPRSSQAPLREQRQRLLGLDLSDESVAATLKLLDQLLSAFPSRRDDSH